MVQKFRMPKYVNIWRSNEKGNKDNQPLEAEMGGTRKIGGKLMVRTLAPHWKEKDLGTILEGEESQDSGYDFRTEQGWFHIEYNEELSIMLDDHVGWLELYD